MRFSLSLLVCLGMAPIVVAGLFNPDRPSAESNDGGKLIALSDEDFLLRISDIRSAGTTSPETKSRQAALATRNALAKSRDLSPVDQVRLGIVLLTLREYDAAFNELRSAYGRNRNDYWAMSVLGTANLQLGQYEEAASFLEAARGQLQEAERKNDPISPPLSADDKLVAEYEFRLAKLRRNELIRLPPGQKPPPATDTDNLFDVQLHGEAGVYEAGRLVESEKKKLPGNAIAIVQRLLYWLPDDHRLYWLLGELYNANGDIDAALSVFNECLDSRRFDTPKLREHRQTLMAAVSARPAPPIAWLPGQGRLITVGTLAVLVLFSLFCLQYRQVSRRRKR